MQKMNNTSTEYEKDTNVSNTYTNLPLEWKATFCVIAGLVIILVCLLYFCVVKYRKKKMPQIDDTCLTNNRWIYFHTNFPAVYDRPFIFKKTNATFQDNLLYHSSCSRGRTLVCADKNEMCQAFIEKY